MGELAGSRILLLLTYRSADRPSLIDVKTTFVAFRTSTAERP